MASSPPSSPGRGHRGDTITFAEPDFSDTNHAGNDDENAHETEEKSDDETLAARSSDEKKDSNDESPSFLERIKSAPKAAKKKIRLKDAEFGGTSHHMNPTSAKLNIRRGSAPRRASTAATGELPTSSGDPIRDFEIMWRSRDNRKGSTAVPVSPRGGSITMRMVFSSKDIGLGIWRMFTTFPYWDMSFWSGWSYSVGSALFVIDGFWSWLPLIAPSTDFPGNSKYGVPLGFFFGALFYQLGAVMAYLEAINDGSFAGSAMKRLLLGHDKEAQEILDKKLGAFFGHLKPGHHAKEGEDGKLEKGEIQVDPEAGWRSMQKRERKQSTYPGMRRGAPRRGGLDLGEPEEGETVEYLEWRWWPTWHRLRTHHIYEIGYLSCAIQLLGVTLYGVTSIVILPGILDSLSEWQENVAYWIPQIVASLCFLIASFGFTWETQVKWYKPEFHVLGWWIGFWSTVGSVGFLYVATVTISCGSFMLTMYRLCSIFGILSYTSTGNEYQSSLSTTWGSIAYLIGSMLQWYEAVNKHSVDELFDGAGDSGPSRLQPLNRGVSERTEIDRGTGAPLSAEQTMMSPMATRQPNQQTKSRESVRDPEQVEHQLESK